jgi:hypothetical protein
LLDLGVVKYNYYIKEGLDCYGLAMLIFRERGVKLPGLPCPDTEIETNRRVMDSLDAAIPNTPLERPEPFCVIESSRSWGSRPIPAYILNTGNLSTLSGVPGSSLAGRTAGQKR